MTANEINESVGEFTEETTQEVTEQERLQQLKAKINNVLAELPGISKEEVSFWSKAAKRQVSFPAFTSDMILNTIRPLVAKQGLGLFIDEGDIYSAHNHTLIEYIFTLWDKESGEERTFKITNPISNDMKDSAAFQSADTFVIKRFWRRLLMIADPKENEELDQAVAADRSSEDFQSETIVATIYSIIENDESSKNRPTHFGIGTNKDGQDIQVSLWENNLTLIAAMLGRQSSALISNMPISFTEPLYLVVDSNKYGSWGISRNKDQVDSLRNKAIGYSFMKITNASEEDAIEALGVENGIEEFDGTIQDALGKWSDYQAKVS